MLSQIVYPILTNIFCEKCRFITSIRFYDFGREECEQCGENLNLDNITNQKYNHINDKTREIIFFPNSVRIDQFFDFKNVECIISKNEVNNCLYYDLENILNKIKNGVRLVFLYSDPNSHFNDHSFHLNFVKKLSERDEKCLCVNSDFYEFSRNTFFDFLFIFEIVNPDLEGLIYFKKIYIEKRDEKIDLKMLKMGFEIDKNEKIKYYKKIN